MVLSEIESISSMGELGPDRMISNMPKKYHEQAKDLRGKDIIVTIREAFEHLQY